MQHRLYKKEKLCSSIAIDAIFGNAADSHSALAYPLRAVWRRNDGRRSDSPLQFLISVPKRRLRLAVDRVTMRRRIRESYRLSQRGQGLPEGARIDVAFVYIANGLASYDKVESAMHKLLRAITTSCADGSDQ